MWRWGGWWDDTAGNYPESMQTPGMSVENEAAELRAQLQAIENRLARLEKTVAGREDS
jgi:hypothetical protein